MIKTLDYYILKGNNATKEERTNIASRTNYQCKNFMIFPICFTCQKCFKEYIHLINDISYKVMWFKLFMRSFYFFMNTTYVKCLQMNVIRE